MPREIYLFFQNLGARGGEVRKNWAAGVVDPAKAAFEGALHYALRMQLARCIGYAVSVDLTRHKARHSDRYGSHRSDTL